MGDRMNARAQRDAGTTGYSVREMCRLVGISARQLGYWRLIGVVAPRGVMIVIESPTFTLSALARRVPMAMPVAC